MKEKILIFISKFLICIVITLVILIFIKSSNNFKTTFYKEVYNTNLSFGPLINLYNKYIGDLDFLNTTEKVFNEEMIYKSKEKYKDGVKIELENNLIHINESGVVVFIGEKEGYGNTIIIQRIDGIDEWYGGISNYSVALFDYVKKGDLLGEVEKDLYLIYKKDGNVLNYEEYIK